MGDKFPLPPRATEFAELIRLRLKEAEGQGGTRETVTVEWNEKPLHVDVVDVPLEGLYFNPRTHRIRAQQSHDPAKEAVLREDPYSSVAQDYLAFLLQAEPSDPRRRDTEFDKLSESLHDFGQSDPGLVTHFGVLVNGNTRAAAMRELGMRTMRVGVLPESFTWDDVFAVELSLQMRKDHRRDYSFINRLLAMDEFSNLGLTNAAIAREFRVHEKTVVRERWIFSVIEEMIERSASPGGSRLRYVDFEGHQEKLRELFRAFTNANDEEQAELLKEIRVAAALLEFSKTDVRVIDEVSKFQEKYLRPELPADIFGGELDAGSTLAGLDDVVLPGDSDAVTAARDLTNQVLREKADSLPGAPVSKERNEEAGKTYETLKGSFKEAIENAKQDRNIKQRKQQAPARLKAAKAAIDQCVADVAQARASHSFDQDSFDDAVVELRSSIRKLAQQASRGVPNPGDGVAWLLAAAVAEGDG